MVTIHDNMIIICPSCQEEIAVDNNFDVDCDCGINITGKFSTWVTEKDIMRCEDNPVIVDKGIPTFICQYCLKEHETKDELERCCQDMIC